MQFRKYKGNGASTVYTDYTQLLSKQIKTSHTIIPFPLFHSPHYSSVYIYIHSFTFLKDFLEIFRKKLITFYFLEISKFQKPGSVFEKIEKIILILREFLTGVFEILRFLNYILKLLLSNSILFHIYN